MITRRSLIAATPFLLPASKAFSQQLPVPQPPSTLSTVLDRAAGLEPLKVVLAYRNGETLAERAFNGNSLNASTNIKSASKSIISCLVGIAIDRKLLEGADQKIAPILRADLPRNPDPRINDITIGNLLSMQSGLSRMSGPNYGRWVASSNWVRFALSEPLDGEPGARCSTRPRRPTFCRRS